MDFYRNVAVSGDYHQPEQVLASPSCSKLGAALTPTTSLDDLFSAQNMEVDVSMEWLSIFVEDCLSSTGNCLPPLPNSPNPEIPNTASKSSEPLKQKPQQDPSNTLEKFTIPGRARSKRNRVTSVKTRNTLSSWACKSQQTLRFATSDPPLLHHQAYWLADSELIMPKKARTKDGEVQEEEEKEVITPSDNINNNRKESLGILDSSSSGQPRRCSHCLAQRTPQWRAGPLGPKTLCNACGVRYKSGRLLPEYRPAKSPTFVSYLHSNSHKKVLEMRMATTATATATTTTASATAAVFNS